ncbi:uncharacterized protein [Antedon mediterranea]|uniref:uncharacterized protein n=1 Tax=Antedon mediterranea TaxID=105859 RepID=UPI003AF4EED4
MRNLVFLAIVLMLSEVYATHYRGGTFYWEQIGKSKIRVHWRLAFLLKPSWHEYYCQNIGDHLTSETTLGLTCLDCYSNRTILSPLSFECTSISQDMGWSLLDGYVDYQPDVPIFTMGFMTTGICSDSSWIQLENYGSGNGKCWSLLTKVDTTLHNDSPRVTAGLPVYQVRRGCKRVIDLNPIDINGDPTKCRWANKDECPGVRDSSDVYPVCGQPTELTVLHEKACQIEFITGENELEGWYAASVMIEDFEDKTYSKAKSTVPFQFLLKVTAPGSCVAPIIDVEKCSLGEPGELWSTEVTASLQEDSDATTITEIQGSYPKGMRVEYVSGYGPNNAIVKVRVTFRPMKERTYVYSFTATDNNGVQSNPTSGLLRVSSKFFQQVAPEPPAILPHLSTPAINTVYDGNEDMWILKFDSPVTRPERKSFIRIREIGSNKVITKYNALDPNVVKFSTTDPTVVHYPAPEGLAGGKAYLVDVDRGFGVINFKTPCGDSASAASDHTIYRFDTAKPPQPEVECGDSYIKVRIPKSKVKNIPASKLHLHDPRCKVKQVNANYYEIKFAYDECGTTIKKVSKTKTRFFNTIRDDPKPIFKGAPVTREKHKIEMKIICEIKGLGVSDVYFKPAAALKPKKYKATGEFQTYLRMYEDSTFSKQISGTAAVELKEKLYFAAHATTPGKEVAIESCRAMAKHGTCTENDKKYTFIKDGCAVDSTASISSDFTGIGHNFLIDSFGFLQYGLTNEILVKCKMVTCDPGVNDSRCSELKQGGCVPRSRRSLSFEKETDAFMTLTIE